MAVVFGGAIFGISKIMENSTPLQEATTKVIENPHIKSQLGEPVEKEFMFSGNMNTTPTGGSADIYVPINGSKSSGKVHIVAEKVNGTWVYSEMMFYEDNSDFKVNLITDSLQ